MTEDVRLRAGNGFFIGNSHDAERLGNSGLQHRRSDCFAETTVNHVFFDGDDGFAFAPRFKNGLGVERLYGVDRENPHLNTFFRELSRSLKADPSQLLYEPSYRGVEIPR